MTNTPRTPDDAPIVRQRENEATRKERVPDDGRSARQRIEAEKQSPDFARRMEEERLRPDFIERTKPEDPSDRFGQLTRDNVNPDIPSAEPGKGGIVDPTSLGMPQGGVAPAPQHTEEQEQAIAVAKAQHLSSLNEPPPGSDVIPGGGPTVPPELPPLVLSDIDPDTMVVGTGTFSLTVTGSGFGPESVVVFDDVDVPTTFVSTTELTADCPVSAAADIVDVEVHRGDDMSDVLQFEFTAVVREGREKKPPARKPSKGKKGKR